MTTFSPGQTAARSGFSIETLRYYERIGLLEDVARAPGGQRVFSEDDLAWLDILRCLRDTGMPIARMLRYAELARGGEDTVKARCELLEEHDKAVGEQIALLKAQRTHIRDKIAFYRSLP